MKINAEYEEYLRDPDSMMFLCDIPSQRARRESRRNADRNATQRKREHHQYELAASFIMGVLVTIAIVAAQF